MGVAVGLATLLVAALLGVTAGSVPASASPAAGRTSTAPDNGPVITIGVAAALGDAVGSVGWPEANAVQLAVDQANAGGGVDIGGVMHTLAVITENSECSPDGGVTAANALVNGGAAAVVGHSCSSASVAAQGIYDAAGVPMISPSSTALELTDQGYPTTFRICPRDDAAPVIMATRLRQWVEIDTAALVAMDGFEWASEVFSNTFASLGGIVTSHHTVTSITYYGAVLTAIRAENPDVVYYVDTDVNNAGLFSTTANDLGLDVVAWDTGWALEGLMSDYVTAAGQAVEEDYIGMSARLPDDMPGYEGLNGAYQAAGFTNYGDDAGMWGAYGYDAANIIIAAIDRADSTDPADIRDEIAATTDYAGVVGTYEGFDDKGDVIPQWVWMRQYVNGAWVPVLRYKMFLPLTQKND